MRQMRVVGPALSCLIFAGACATAGSTTAGSPPSPAQQVTIAQIRDSLIAQRIADHVGPGASIRASFANLSGSRRVQGLFRVDDDAYVIVGHLDPDGTVRVIFPLEPEDDGFVRGEKSYRTQEVFAGFVDAYRQRLRNSLFQPIASFDSYDRGIGYMFVIASWRPMRFDRIATDGKFDNFELTDEKSMTHPQEAVEELAAILAGENREAYTISYARYTNTQALYAGMPGTSYSAFGYGFCNNFNVGLGGSPFALLPYLGSNTGMVWYRGTAYYADEFGDCYRAYNPYQAFGYSGYQIAGIPTPSNPRPIGGRIFNAGDHRTPLTPHNPTPRTIPVVADAPTNAAPETPQVSPRYRERGLITAEDPTPRTGRVGPRVDAGNTLEDRRRPAIQDMLTRRVQAGDNGSASNSGWSRAQSAPRDNANYGNSNYGGASDSRASVRGNDDARTATPRSDDNRGSYRAPTTDSPRQAPAPRSEQAPRSEPMRSEPARAEPMRAEPRSAPVSAPPASSGSSSSGSGTSTPVHTGTP